MRNTKRRGKVVAGYISTDVEGGTGHCSGGREQDGCENYTLEKKENEKNMEKEDGN
jgi:hypothetical protein